MIKFFLFKKKPHQSLVRLTIASEFDFSIKNDIPIYSLKMTNYTLIGSNVRSVNVNDLSKENIANINLFITNLSSMVTDPLLMLSNALSANRYLSTLYDNVLKAWRLFEILKNNREIVLLVDSVEELMLWKNFFLTNNICVTSNLKMFKWNFHFKLKHFAQKMIEILKKYFLIKCNKKKDQGFFKTIFIHWIDNKDISYEQIINNSNYFGKMLANLAKTNKISLLGHIPDGNEYFKDIIKLNFNFIMEYVSFLDVFLSLFKSFKLFSLANKKFLLNDCNLTIIVWNAIKKDFFNCTYLKTILFYKAFQRIVKNFKSDSVIIYPFENQPWEKALLKACCEQQVKFNVYAYQFFPIPENFLIHQFSEKARSFGLIPTKILTSDQLTDEAFKKQGLDTIKFGSVRYSNLINYKINIIEKRKVILCCLFLDETEAIDLTKKIIELSKFLLEYDFIINHHPYLSKEIILTVLSLIKDKKNISLSNQSINYLLTENILLLIYNSSSVCFEAALRGIPILYLFSEDIINLDRFNGLGKASTNIYDSIDFIKKLKNNKDFYKNYLNQLYKTANSIIIPLDYQNMDAIVI